MVRITRAAAIGALTLLVTPACDDGAASRADGSLDDAGYDGGEDAGLDGGEDAGDADAPCTGGLTRCDGECVDLASEPAHCGGCGEACEPSQECVESVCADLTCLTEGCPHGSYCDGAVCQPGCDDDAQCPQPGACDLGTHTCACDPGTHLCGAGCVPDDDPGNCGPSCASCEAPAGGSAECVDGQCVPTCPPGHDDCGGVCLPVTSTGNCGGGCTVCGAPDDGLPTCDGLHCGVSCDPGYHACGVECLSDSSVASCGERCSPCPAPDDGEATCDGGVCGFICDVGTARCGEGCVPESPSQCGDACDECTDAPENASPICDSGACGFECDLGFVRCGEGCCPAIGVAAGRAHSCAILGESVGATSGRVVCWGINFDFQIGDDTITQRPRPTATFGLGENVTAISAGEDHTCAIQGGGLLCWGSLAYGKLGFGEGFGGDTPEAVVGMSSGVAQVSAGADHTCAVTSDGALRCWGRNLYGRLGTGDLESSDTPRTVYEAGVAEVAAGRAHTCARLTDGSVTCWGYAHHGQIGVSRSSATDCGTGLFDPYCKTSPTAVSGLDQVVALAAGGNHTCAIREGGELLCWGQNHKGQLGLGSDVDSRHAPTTVPGLSSGVAAVSLGSSHTCALLETGAVRCWGYNDYGQVGNGTTSFSGIFCGPFGAPSCDGPGTSVVGFESGGAARLEAGTYHSCALDSAGALWCWGENGTGQLGDETTTHRTSPVRVTGR